MLLQCLMMCMCVCVQCIDLHAVNMSNKQSTAEAKKLIRSWFTKS